MRRDLFSQEDMHTRAADAAFAARRHAARVDISAAAACFAAQPFSFTHLLVASYGALAT